MTNEEKVQSFLSFAESRKGCTALWGQKGPDVFDCSGLVAWSLLRAGFKNPDAAKPGRLKWAINLNWNAQRMANDLPSFTDIRMARRGDLCFYGTDMKRVTHVVIYMGTEGVLSASGATSKITDLEQAKRLDNCRVRIHPKHTYRRDFLAFGAIKPYLDRIP